MPGFTRGRKLDKIGLHAQDTAELFFDDVRCPRPTCSAVTESLALAASTAVSSPEFSLYGSRTSGL